MVEFDVVVEKLHGFETADDLADYFRSYGIQATPTDARSCAISAFVVAETGLSGQIVTTTREITLEQTIVEDGGYTYQEQIKEFHHTKAMKDFVRAYDRGDYPDLAPDGWEFDKDFDATVYECHCTGCN